MNAVDDYEKAKFSVALPPDQRVREAVMSILVAADAAIAELEDKIEWLGTMNSTLLDLRESVVLEEHQRAENAETKLAELKARRCEDCGWEYCTTEDYSESWVDDTSLEDTSTDFYCARWKARP